MNSNVKGIWAAVTSSITIVEWPWARESRDRENRRQWEPVDIYLCEWSNMIHDEFTPVSCTANCRQIAGDNLESLLIRIDYGDSAVLTVRDREENSHGSKHTPIRVLAVIMCK
jgi:hypothetical protein